MKRLMVVFAFLVSTTLTGVTTTILRTQKIFLKPQTKIWSLYEDRFIKLSEGAFVTIQVELIDGKQTYYVLTPDKKKLYIIEPEDIVPIEDEITLLPKPEENKIIPARSYFHAYNKSTPFETNFIFSLEQLSLTPLATLIDLKDQRITAPRLLISTFYKSPIPIDLGIGLSYQEASLVDQNKQTQNFLIITFGPQLKWHMLINAEFELNSLLSYELPLNYHIRSSLETQTYAGHILAAEIQTLFHTSYGHFISGLGLRKHEIYLQSRTSNLAIPSNELNTYSLSFSLGYNIPWSL